MTVTSQTNKVVANGNGVTTVFSYNFIIQNASDLVVIYTDTLGVSTTLLSSAYSVSGVGNPTGGTVTYNPGGTPIATGTTLTMTRQLTLTQPTSIANQGSFYPQAVESAIDRTVMLTQQINEVAGRFLSAPITDPNPMSNLPSATQRANKGLLFDASGNPIAGTTPATGVISAPMQPVVGAASLSAARTAFGLGAMALEGLGKGIQDDGAGNARVNFLTETKAVSYLIATTDHLENYLVTGPVTFTLPATATLWNGFGFFVDVDGGALTLTPNAADTMEGGATGAGTYVPTSEKAFIFTDGAGRWFINRFKQYSTAASPGGYLTLVSNTPVILDDVVSATTIYYTPDVSGIVPVFTGAEWISYPFSELSCALNATQQPILSAHDMFIIAPNGVPTLIIGPSWRQAGFGNGTGGFTSLTNAAPIVCTATGHGLSNGDLVFFSGVQGNTAANGAFTVSGVAGAAFTLTGSTGNGTYSTGTGTFASRGDGTGTSQLARQGGLRVNAVTLTGYNGVTPYTVSAGQATYVGSILIDSTAGQVTCYRGLGQQRKWGVWNAYNRKNIFLRGTDPTASWAYLTAVWRQSNGDVNNYLSMFVGLPEEPINLMVTQRISVAGACGVGYTSIVNPTGVTGSLSSTAGNVITGNTARFTSYPTIGLVRLQPLDYNATTAYGTESAFLYSAEYRG